ncbi:MAG: hypothetical protein RL291_1751, partial [Pseudomonadota bacterium]
MTVTAAGPVHAATDLEGWDPTRIKKGSRIIPLLLLLLVAIAFAVTRMPVGRDLLFDHHVRSCELARAANAKAAAPATAPATPATAPATAPPSSLVQECLNSTDPTLATFKARLQSMPAHLIATEAAGFDSKAVGMAETARGFAASVKLFVDELVAAFRKHAWGG